MQSNSLNFESWDTEEPFFPERSEVFGLEPFGLGTPEIESLSSYITRLAAAHCISLYSLISTKVLPLLNKNSILEYHGRTNINGFNKGSLQFVSVLNSLTGRNDIDCLTLLRWNQVISQKGLMKYKKAWCTSCFQEQMVNNIVVYEPLIWSFRVVDSCAKHGKLSTFCPNCLAEQNYISYNAQIGYCQKCSFWLGQRGDRQQITKWESFIHENLGDLLSHNNKVTNPSKGRISIVLNYVVNKHEGGIAINLSRKLQVGESSFKYWLYGEKTPQIDVSLRIAKSLGMRVTDLFLGEKYIHIEGMPQKIDSNVTPILSNNNRVIDKKHVEEYLNEIIDQNEPNKPKSLNTISKELGYTSVSLNKYFPVQCKIISKRFIEYRKTESEKKITRSCDEIQDIVNKLHSNKTYPSQRLVRSMLANSNSFLLPQVRNTYYSLLEKYGYRL